MNDQPANRASYKGWRIEVSDEHSDEDVTKWTHTAVHDDGRTIELDFSPYEKVEPDVLALLVDMDFPTRATWGLCGPLSNELLRPPVHGPASWIGQCIMDEMVDFYRRTEAGVSVALAAETMERNLITDFCSPRPTGGAS